MNAKNKNIQYKSKELVEFYCSNRQMWEEFYPSERWVFERIAGEKGALGDVLDVGCACGGLGAALDEKFNLNSYTGVDIHKAAIEWAKEERKLSIPTSFICSDITEIDLNTQYDIVVSLSCADWNIETGKIIDACWKWLREDGYFVISLRLTSRKGINDVKKSYQYIKFSEDEKRPEIANYVVFNFKEALNLIKGLKPHPRLIGCYGYWGTPSATAVTLFDKLVFAVFYIQKGNTTAGSKIDTEFNLPLELFLEK